MAETTGISWTHHTFNPWWGCEKVSPACRGCYAERDAKRYRPDVTLWGPGSVRQVASDDYWKAPLKWARAAKAAGERRRVFCASMADVFERREDLEEPRARLFRLIEETPELDWLLLTKRPENVLELASDAGWFSAQVWSWRTNVWVGTTVEDQEHFEPRVRALLAVPARIRFLSIEPLLGPLDLTRAVYDRGRAIRRAMNGPMAPNEEQAASLVRPCGIHWIIVGGESGPAARPMDPAWARALRDQAQAAGVAFHFKQWGEYLDGSRIGKKNAGRELDGRTWDEVPA